MPTFRQVIKRANQQGMSALQLNKALKRATGMDLNYLQKHNLFDSEVYETTRTGPPAPEPTPSLPTNTKGIQPIAKHKGAQRIKERKGSDWEQALQMSGSDAVLREEYAKRNKKAQEEEAKRQAKAKAVSTLGPSAAFDLKPKEEAPPLHGGLLNPVDMAKKVYGAAKGVLEAFNPQEGSDGLSLASFPAIEGARKATVKDIKERRSALTEADDVQGAGLAILTGMYNAVTDVGEVVGAIPMLMGTFLLAESGEFDSIKSGQAFGKMVAGGAVGGFIGELQAMWDDPVGSFYARPMSSGLVVLPPLRAVVGAAHALPGAAKARKVFREAMEPFKDKIEFKVMLKLEQGFVDGLATGNPLYTALLEEWLIDPQRGHAATGLLAEAMQKQTELGLIEGKVTPVSEATWATLDTLDTPIDKAPPTKPVSTAPTGGPDPFAVKEVSTKPIGGPDPMAVRGVSMAPKMRQTEGPRGKDMGGEVVADIGEPVGGSSVLTSEQGWERIGRAQKRNPNEAHLLSADIAELNRLADELRDLGGLTDNPTSISINSRWNALFDETIQKAADIEAKSAIKVADADAPPPLPKGPSHLPKKRREVEAPPAAQPKKKRPTKKKAKELEDAPLPKEPDARQESLKAALQRANDDLDYWTNLEEHQKDYAWKLDQDAKAIADEVNTKGKSPELEAKAKELQKRRQQQRKMAVKEKKVQDVRVRQAHRKVGLIEAELKQGDLPEVQQIRVHKKPKSQPAGIGRKGEIVVSKTPWEAEPDWHSLPPSGSPAGEQVRANLDDFGNVPFPTEAEVSKARRKLEAEDAGVAKHFPEKPSGKPIPPPPKRKGAKDTTREPQQGKLKDAPEGGAPKPLPPKDFELKGEHAGDQPPRPPPPDKPFEGTPWEEGPRKKPTKKVEEPGAEYTVKVDESGGYEKVATGRDLEEAPTVKLSPKGAKMAQEVGNIMHEHGASADPVQVRDAIAQAWNEQSYVLLRSPTLRKAVQKELQAELVLRKVADKDRAASMVDGIIDMLLDGETRSVLIGDNKPITIGDLVERAVTRLDMKGASVSIRGRQRGPRTKIFDKIKGEAVRITTNQIAGKIEEKGLKTGLEKEANRFTDAKILKTAARKGDSRAASVELGINIADKLYNAEVSERGLALPKWADPKQVAAAIRRRGEQFGSQAINDVADHYERFVKLEIGGFDGWVQPEVGRLIDWHVKSREALRNNAHVGRFVAGAKASYTARSTSSITTNAGANYGMNTTRRGYFGPGYVYKLGRAAYQYVQWRGGKKTSPKLRLQFEQAIRRGVFSSNKLDADIGDLSKLKKLDFGSFLPGNAFLERLFKWGDQIFKLEEFLWQWDNWEKDIKGLGAGRSVDVPISTRKTVKLTRVSKDFVDIEGHKARGGKVRVHIDGKVMHDILGRVSAKPGLDLMFAYDDTSLISKMMRASQLHGIGSDFYTWNSKAVDIPFVKKGLVGHVVDNPYARVTDDPKLLAKTVARSMGLAARRGLILNGLRSQFLDTPDKELRKQFNWATNDEKILIVRMLSDGKHAQVSDLSTMNYADPSQKMMKILMYGGVKAFQTASWALGGHDPRQKNPPDLTPKQTRRLERFRKLLIMADSQELGSGKDVLDFIALGGGPFMDAINDLWKTADAGSILTPEMAARTSTYMLMGGTYSKAINVAAGGISDAFPGTMAGEAAGAISSRHRSLTDSVKTTQPYANWMLDTMAGKGTRIVNVAKKGSTQNHFSHLSKQRKEMMRAWGVWPDLEEQFDARRLAEKRGDEKGRAVAHDKLETARARYRMITNWANRKERMARKLYKKLGMRVPAPIKHEEFE